ncbi:Hint domain-containing protein [Octadecabacter sp. 1_MG-2023]|uniref:Hint domain-containing protein n=1 Tax=unclassified Octadecabacter TaxID=196158 RepID=UPI001C09D71B|nr:MULTISPECIES: Hint domain-containing protein [unclassified Octadecabacter]MBU2992050.1 Hint domain-containing protein [Octadecabacter sp. B2R22]MDO6736026.1 Hint domain-containing protein [Octadecabacter sp. 1_MG-2023]
MPTSFEVLYLGNLDLIDTQEGDQLVDTTAVNSWLGTYGSAANPLASTDNVMDWVADDFSGGQSTNYDLDNSNSSDTFTVDGVQQTYDAAMVFNAQITYFDGTTATITAVVAQAENGDTYLMPEFSANADQAAIEAQPIQSLELISPIYGSNNTGQAFNLVADRQAADLVPCFSLGTRIATNNGEKRVEEIKAGDLVLTRDSGLQEVRWVGRRDVTAIEMKMTPEWTPISVSAGALGPNMPETDMTVSPNHRILLTGERAALLFGENEVLAAAKHLLAMEGVSQAHNAEVSYFHLLFDRHEVVLSNGAWTESFQPGDYTLKGIGNSQRNEIFELFPELQDEQGLEGYQSARRALKMHEAKLLVG